MMRWIKRTLAAMGVVTVLGLGALAFAMSYEASCGEAEPVHGEVRRVKAVVHRCYGPPQVMAFEDVALPELEPDQIHVSVRSIGLNPLEWHKVRGEPYFLRLSRGLGTPKSPRMGADFAGVVTAVGSRVTRFKTGDEVFGRSSDSMASEIIVHESTVALKPSNVTFDQAAAVPVAGITALQALRDRGAIQPGQKVLINGASGGVGTFAVQIGKAMGAEVTGVCSTRNVDLVRSLGAIHVIDYTQQNFTEADVQYDVIVDNVGSQSVASLRRVLKPGGSLIIIGSASKDPWIGPMRGMLAAAVFSPFVDEKMGLLMARMNAPDLTAIGELMRKGQVTPVIDRSYPFAKVAEALAYLEQGRARGKVVLTLD